MNGTSTGYSSGGSTVPPWSYGTPGISTGVDHSSVQSVQSPIYIDIPAHGSTTQPLVPPVLSDSKEQVLSDGRKSPVPIESFMGSSGRGKGYYSTTETVGTQQQSNMGIYSVGPKTIKAMLKACLMAPQAAVGFYYGEGKPITIIFSIGYIGEMEFIISKNKPSGPH